MNLKDYLQEKIHHRITFHPKTCIINILLLLLSVELLFQIVAYIRYRKSVNVAFRAYSIDATNWYLRQKDNRWWLDMKLPRTYDPFLGFMTKNIDSPYVHVDENGVRKTVYNPPNTNKNQLKKVYFFGGSAVFGANVKDQETVPSLAARMLNTANAAYEISNYGQMAYNVNQETIFLTRQLKSGNVPDVVIFYDGCNEYFSSHLLDEYQQIYDELYIKDRIGDISAFELRLPDNTTLIDAEMWKGLLSTRVKTIDYVIRVVNQVKKKLAGTPAIPVQQENRDVINKKIVNNYIQNVQFITMLSKAYHFTPLFFWQPIIQNKNMTKDEMKVNSAALYERDEYNHMTELINSAQLPNQYDLTHIFSSYDTTSFFVDNCHVTPQGNEIVAGAMTQIVIDKGL